MDLHEENPHNELTKYVEARGWEIPRVYADKGPAGAKESRPALRQLLRDGKRRRLDVVVCWRLDLLGRNLKLLIILLDELQALGVGFVSLAEGLETTPAGKLQEDLSIGACRKIRRRQGGEVPR